MTTKVQNITGEKFGKLTAEKYLYTEKGKSSKWLCKCDCGNKTEVELSSLRSGNTKSCGCLHKESMGKLAVHNKTKTTEYYAWSNMIQRCRNVKHPEYKNYGERGIQVCDQWENSFECFLEDMGEKPSKKHSLDRINNDDGYYKENCRWADSYTQAANQRDKENKTTGIKNISYSKRDDLYCVGIERKGIRYRKCFKSLDDAVNWKNEILEQIS